MDKNLDKLIQNIVNDAKGKIMEDVKGRIKEAIDCPNCSNPFDLIAGVNTCPHCQHEITLTVVYK